MNKTLKLLIASDIMIWSGFGLIVPIIAIFIKDNLIGGSIEAAGLASAIFLLTKSVLQPLFAKRFNPEDRLWLLYLGGILIFSVPFVYAFSTSIIHIYIAQLIYGIGASFNYPAWFSLFVTNLDKKKEGYEWSLYSTGIGLGAGVAAYLGASLAALIGFKTVFIIAGTMSIISWVILLALYSNNIRGKKKLKRIITKPFHIK